MSLESLASGLIHALHSGYDDWPGIIRAGGPLRRQSQNVVGRDCHIALGLSELLQPLGFLQGPLELGDGQQTMIDHGNGRIWQHPGRGQGFDVAAAAEYVSFLNSTGFAGIVSWRLPTVPELLSLLRPQAKAWPDGFAG